MNKDKLSSSLMTQSSKSLNEILEFIQKYPVQPIEFHVRIGLLNRIEKLFKMYRMLIKLLVKMENDLVLRREKSFFLHKFIINLRLKLHRKNKENTETLLNLLTKIDNLLRGK